MTEIWYMGIDPGATGSIGLVRADGGAAAVHDMPTSELEIYRLLQNLTTLTRVVRAGIEKVNAFPGQGSSTMFQFGFNAGLAQMALIATHVPWEAVHAMTWTKELGLSARKPSRQKRTAGEIAAEKAAKAKMTRDERRAEGRERAAKQRDKKRAYRAMAERLFPGLVLRADNADSVLIAECIRRRHERHAALSAPAAEEEVEVEEEARLPDSPRSEPPPAPQESPPQRSPEPPAPPAWAL